MYAYRIACLARSFNHRTSSGPSTVASIFWNSEYPSSSNSKYSFILLVTVSCTFLSLTFPNFLTMELIWFLIFWRLCFDNLWYIHTYQLQAYWLLQMHLQLILSNLLFDFNTPSFHHVFINDSSFLFALNNKTMS